MDRGLGLVRPDDVEFFAEGEALQMIVDDVLHPFLLRGIGDGKCHGQRRIVGRKCYLGRIAETAPGPSGDQNRR